MQRYEIIKAIEEMILTADEEQLSDIFEKLAGYHPEDWEANMGFAGMEE